MPSLQHAVVAALVGRLRTNLPPDDVPAMREALTEENRHHREGPPSRVRTGHEEHISNDRGFPVVSLWKPTAGGTPPTRAVVYLHGGGYVHPSDPRHWAFATRLADTLGARLVMPLYPLAPEFTVEDSFDEVADLVEELVGQSPQGVVLVGDSAGGGYALAVAEELRDRGGPQPRRLVLLAPWVDLSSSSTGIAEAAARDPWLSHDHLSIYASFWAGSDDPAVLAGPRVSPGLGDLTGLPRALMFCGTRDLLQPGCDDLFARADEAGWDLAYVVAPGLVHVYPLLPIPEAKRAFDSIVEFCRDD